MPIIPNFPREWLEEHTVWHHQYHVTPGTMPPPGFGEQFLRFHRYFINKVYDWFDRVGYDKRAVAGWPQMPAGIMQAPCMNQQALYRIMYNPRSFSTLDGFGRFIEYSGVHGCIHATAARLYNNPEIDNFDLCTRQTEFYNIHGMVDQWYRNWEAAWGVRSDSRGKPQLPSGVSVTYNRAMPALSTRSSSIPEARIQQLGRLASPWIAHLQPLAQRPRKSVPPVLPRTSGSYVQRRPQIQPPLLRIATLRRQAARSIQAQKRR